MQLIEGVAISELIADLRKVRHLQRDEFGEALNSTLAQQNERTIRFVETEELYHFGRLEDMVKFLETHLDVEISLSG